MLPPQAADIFLSQFSPMVMVVTAVSRSSPPGGRALTAAPPVPEGTGTGTAAHGIAVLMVAQDQFHGSLFMPMPGWSPAPGQVVVPMAGMDIVIPWQGLLIWAKDRTILYGCCRAGPVAVGPAEQRVPGEHIVPAQVAQAPHGVTGGLQYGKFDSGERILSPSLRMCSSSGKSFRFARFSSSSPGRA